VDIKKLAVPLILVLIIVVGAVVFTLRKPSSGSKPNSADSSLSPAADGSSIKTTPQSGTFSTFLSFTVPQKCTFNSPTDSKVVGTVYLNNGVMRADISVPASDSSAISSHMIVEKNYSYIWQDGQTQGVRIAFDAQAQTRDPQPGTVDPNTGVTYICEPWIVDPQMLTRPEKMIFTDLSKLVLPTGLPSGNAEACAACNDLADDQSKMVCLVRLKCK
jgi:hypothetical protein